MTRSLRPPVAVALVWCATAISSDAPMSIAAQPQTLQLEVFVGEADSWDVTSTLIYGKTEAILVDSQFRISQAKKLADRIATTGRRLKAIIITHPDYDHYIGMPVLAQRFPDAPIYMTAAGLEAFKRTSRKYLAAKMASEPSETPDRLPAPEVLPTSIFSVDDQAVEVIQDFPGDVLKATNGFLWIPSLRAVIAGDIVFNGVHVWLGDSTPESRRAWHESLRLMSALHPRVIVAGHKKNANVPDSPQVIASMETYLDDFESARSAASSAGEVVAVMKRKYPDLAQEKLLVFSAKTAISGAAHQ